VEWTYADLENVIVYVKALKNLTLDGLNPVFVSLLKQLSKKPLPQRIRNLPWRNTLF